MDPERVDVLHRAHGDAGVVGVAHHLVLNLLPADETALDHDLAAGARPETGTDPLAVLVLRLDDPAAGPAKRECRADDGGQADRRKRGVCRFLAVDGARTFHDRAWRIRLTHPVEE